MIDALGGIVIGFVSGVLSGQFGIGGGLVTTPAIRLVLGHPALVAVGTPLPVIIPTAIAGALSYRRAGMVDLRGGLSVGAAGALTSVGGALLTPLIGGSAILLLTAVLIAYMALRILRPAAGRRSGEEDGRAGPEEDRAPARARGRGTSPRDRSSSGPNAPRESSRTLRLVLLGIGAGFYSGLLGLGGGFVIVPLLNGWLRYPLKRAIGTSLVAIAVIAVPGTITHYALGNVDPALAGQLALGVVPGALLGARMTQVAQERTVRGAFSLLLLASASVLVLRETGLL